MDILRDYIEDGERAVLFSTHITADLERSADFITYITGGRLYFSGPKDEFEESFRIVRGGPDELRALPDGAVLGAHAYATGFDALVRTELLPAAIAAVPGLVVDSASIDDIIRLTNTTGATNTTVATNTTSALAETGATGAGTNHRR